jgi:hypothetical protein
MKIMSEKSGVEELIKSVTEAMDGQMQINLEVTENLVAASEVAKISAKRILEIDTRLGEIEDDMREQTRKLNVLIDNLGRLLKVSSVDLEY